MEWQQHYDPLHAQFRTSSHSALPLSLWKRKIRSFPCSPAAAVWIWDSQVGSRSSDVPIGVYRSGSFGPMNSIPLLAERIGETWEQKLFATMSGKSSTPCRAAPMSSLAGSRVKTC